MVRLDRPRDDIEAPGRTSTSWGSARSHRRATRGNTRTGSTRERHRRGNPGTGELAHRSLGYARPARMPAQRTTRRTRPATSGLRRIKQTTSAGGGRVAESSIGGNLDHLSELINLPMLRHRHGLVTQARRLHLECPQKSQAPHKSNCETRALTLGQEPNRFLSTASEN